MFVRLQRTNRNGTRYHVQEWTQNEIEDVFRSSGFTILVSRPFVRSGGRYPLLSILDRGEHPVACRTRSDEVAYFLLFAS